MAGSGQRPQAAVTLDPRGGGISRMPLFIIVLGLLAACHLSLAASASAAETHVFSAPLSLTGGTTVSPLDPVPDPGPSHPPEAFGTVCGLAVDSAGNTYVSSLGQSLPGETGRIDIFDPEGKFIQEIVNDELPCSLAVDSEGVLYVGQRETPNAVVRYTPNEYPPTPATIYSGPVVVDADQGSNGIAVNTFTNHLYVTHGNHVNEYRSANEGGALVSSTMGEGLLSNTLGITVDSSTGNVFVGSVCQGCNPIPSGSEPHVSVVYVFSAAGTHIGTIDGADTPAGGFTAPFGELTVAVDEETGELFVDDIEGTPAAVYRFVPSGGGYEWVSDSELAEHSYIPPSAIVVSNGSVAPNHGNVYVLSKGPPGHMYAFIRAGEIGPPLVTGTRFADPTRTEVELKAEIDPNGAPTAYRFEYVDKVTYEGDVGTLGAGHGFDHAILAQSGALPAGHQPIPVSAALTSLAPGTAYLFRVVATNCKVGEPESSVCRTEGDAVTFATYPEAPPAPPCLNDAFRVGLSAHLPDCRAYELVSPPNTNGREPTASFMSYAEQAAFPTEVSNPDGSSVLFMVEGGTLPIPGGSGIISGYEASRSSSGWQTRSSGPDGTQSQLPSAGGASGDHRYWYWATGDAADHGSLVIGGQRTMYTRLPDGSFELIGKGQLADDPRATGHYISPDGSHRIFSSTVPLVPGASPAGTRTIYDRASDGSIAIVSTEPSGTPKGGSQVKFQGTNEAGDTVAFSVTDGGATTLFVHRSLPNSTAPVTTGQTTFAGLSTDGERLTYLKEGNIFSYRLGTGTEAIGSGGASIPVNVSEDGSHVYFVSTKRLTPVATGAVSGQQNLYGWNSATGVSFIAVVTPEDVAGQVFNEGTSFGLGLWVAGTGGPANDPSRTTPDGRVIVFESHGDLTDYDSGGHSEVYRYAEGESPALRCLSCSPALLPAASDAHLQVARIADSRAGTNGMTPAHNVTPDGNAVVFQTADSLVPEDVDGVDDVYEWQAPGKEQCAHPAGCLALISSGHSSEPNFVFAVNRSGQDVFFTTHDLLLAADQDTTVSIYDARINGGFPEDAPAGCSGDACKGQPASPPTLTTPGSMAGSGPGNVSHKKKCRKGKRKVRRKGRIRCVKVHKHSKKHRPSSRKGGVRR